VPGKIGSDEQLSAAYNPFVEALMGNGVGRKSSCIADDSTNSQRTTVPAAGLLDLNSILTAFEDHVRTDYV
jgi:hypothetical protein